MATPVKPTASPKPVADDELKHKTPNKALVEKQQDLLRTGDRSDCTIKCNGKEWRAHTCILCPRSEYFGRALGGNFQEGATGILTFEEEEAYAVEGVLLYLYTYNYPEWPNWTEAAQVRGVTPNQDHTDSIIDSLINYDNESTFEEEGIQMLHCSKPLFSDSNTVPATKWQTHLGIFQLADKLGLEDLQLEARAKVQQALETEWQLENFHELLEVLWDMDVRGSRDLRDAALQVVSANLPSLLTDKAFQTHMACYPAFTANLIGQFVQEKEKLVKEAAAAQAKMETCKKEVEDVLTYWSDGRHGNDSNKSRVRRLLSSWPR